MTDPVLDSQPTNSAGEMDGLCPELLLIPPSLSNRGILEPVQSPCPAGNPTALPADPGCLLVEATATEEDTGNMEIIVEAVAGNLSPGAPGETPGDFLVVNCHPPATVVTTSLGSIVYSDNESWERLANLIIECF